MKWYHALGLATAFAIGSAGCNKHEEVKVDSRISEIRQLAEGPILASGDFMADKWYEDLQSDNLEKVCHAAIWGTGVRYSELMHGASLSFTPGGGYWRRTGKEVDNRYLQEARRLDQARQRLYELCDR